MVDTDIAWVTDVVSDCVSLMLSVRLSVWVRERITTVAVELSVIDADNVALREADRLSRADADTVVESSRESLCVAETSTDSSAVPVREKVRGSVAVREAVWLVDRSLDNVGVAVVFTVNDALGLIEWVLCGDAVPVMERDGVLELDWVPWFDAVMVDDARVVKEVVFVGDNVNEALPESVNVSLMVRKLLDVRVLGSVLVIDKESCCVRLIVDESLDDVETDTSWVRDIDVDHETDRVSDMLID